MEIGGKKQVRYGALFLCTALIFSSMTHASNSEQEYKRALQLAEKKVLRTKKSLLSANALSSSVIKAMLGRYYQEGDSWKVATWQIQKNSMRRTGSARHLQDEINREGIFQYEVIRVKTGMNPEVTLRVTQLPTPGMSLADPKVKSIQITFNDEYKTNKKAYFFQGEESPVAVSNERITADLSPLEMFPLDPPPFEAAEFKQPTELPVLPEKIQKTVSQLPYHPDLSKSVWLEQDDFFGRPVQALWQKGEPWPAYLKTPSGIAILIEKGHL